MALANNFVPNTSLVFGVRDMAPQIDAIQQGDTKGLQNAFKFATGVHDYALSRKQANMMEKNDREKQAIQGQLQADMNELAELKKQLAALEGGV